MGPRDTLTATIDQLQAEVDTVKHGQDVLMIALVAVVVIIGVVAWRLK